MFTAVYKYIHIKQDTRLFHEGYQYQNDDT